QTYDFDIIPTYGRPGIINEIIGAQSPSPLLVRVPLRRFRQRLVAPQREGSWGVGHDKLRKRGKTIIIDQLRHSVLGTLLKNVYVECSNPLAAKRLTLSIP
ncbi:hypothetical protein, partial [Moorena sp. SIO4E2]|uniref:hypothetical protein n=1 Tax=Moorena sp. SIO4E2 TaxID=2607826 RepID=UPI00257978E8